MVFLVIAITVSVQGLSGGIVARILGVARRHGQGYVILGANELARLLAHGLAGAEREVVLLDSNPDACQAAQSEGLRVLHGSGINENVLMRAGLDGRAGALAVTPNDEANLLFARLARQTFRVDQVWVGLRRGHLSVTEEMVRQIGARVLFGQRRQTDLWTLRLERGLAHQETWEFGGAEDVAAEWTALQEQMAVLPLLSLRGAVVRPVDGELKLRAGDQLVLVVFEEKRAAVEEWRADRAWQLVKPPPAQ